MNIIRKIPCLHCTKEFRKREIKFDGICLNCLEHACLMVSIFNYSYKKLILMIDNSKDTNEIYSRYESLFEFAQRELKPWYSYNCFPQIIPENIKMLQEKINQKLLNQINVSLDDLKSQSRL